MARRKTDLLARDVLSMQVFKGIQGGRGYGGTLLFVGEEMVGGESKVVSSSRKGWAGWELCVG